MTLQDWRSSPNKEEVSQGVGGPKGTFEFRVQSGRAVVLPYVYDIIPRKAICK